jgi:hypothetical protein
MLLALGVVAEVAVAVPTQLVPRVALTLKLWRMPELRPVTVHPVEVAAAWHVPSPVTLYVVWAWTPAPAAVQVMSTELVLAAVAPTPATTPSVAATPLLPPVAVADQLAAAG